MPKTKEQYPYIKIIGLKITTKPEPHIKWKELREKLDQWRYGFAYRTSYWPESEVKGMGMKPECVEVTLAAMAKECKGTWPEWWEPKTAR